MSVLMPSLGTHVINGTTGPARTSLNTPQINRVIIEINDPADERLSPFRAIRHRDTSNGFIAEGSLVVLRLLRSEYSLQSLLVHTGQVDRYREQVPRHVPIYVVEPEIGERLAGYDFHRGVLAHAKCRPFHSVDQLRSEQPRLALGLIGISDPENVGSLLRSAAALGIHDIAIGPGTISPYVRRVIRVSMASVFHHRFYELNDPLKQIQGLQEQGIAFAATTLREGAIPIHEFQKPADRSLVLLVGNEASGLSDAIQEACRYHLTLPMDSGTDSLNVGVAGAIFMHELIKQA